MPLHRGQFNVTLFMRGPILVTLLIPNHLVRDARLHSCAQDDTDAVIRVLSDHGRLIAEIRQLRRRVAQIEEEGALLDERLERLHEACRSILEL